MWSSTLLQFRKQNKENKRGTYRQIADYFQYLPLWVAVHTYSNANVFHLRQAVATSVYAAPPAPASPTLSLSSSPCLLLLESRPCSASSLPPSSSRQPASSSLTPSVRPVAPTRVLRVGVSLPSGMSLPVHSEYLPLERIARYRHACSNGSPFATHKPIDIKPRCRRG